MKISDIEVTPIHPERWGDDLDVVNAARVSFHKESEWEYPKLPVGHKDNPYSYEIAGKRALNEKDAKLINYLAKHKHFSPFNHSFISVRVKAPIFVARQLVKHKFMPWNEVSRRYVDEEPEYYLPTHWRARPDNGIKQGSGTETVDVTTQGMDYSENIPVDAVEVCLEAYNRMLKLGVAPEQARMVLPQNTMTEWIWSGTLGAFCDMLKLRLDPHTQYESRIVANKIKELIEPVFPVSLKARLEN